MQLIVSCNSARGASKKVSNVQEKFENLLKSSKKEFYANNFKA